MTTQARWWALGALALSMLTIGLDTTVLTVALPTLALDLHASTAQLQWISTSYTLVLAALLLVAGALGERYGYKRLLLLALLIFGASSVWCAYSGSAAALIAARSILGIGAALLTAFAAWQVRCRHPLVDLALFRAPAFRWGTALSTLMGMAMFGVLFALPLFYQAVQGNSAMGTGVRLLPLIVGLVLGTRMVDRLGERLGAGATIALGFMVTAASLAAGAVTTAATPFVVIAAWLGLVGVGMGLAMPTALNAALGVLEPSRTGSGSALIQALRQAGGTIGVALLGTVINAGYRGATPVVPDAALQARIDASVSSRVAVARAIGRPDLLAAVQSAFVHGMSLMLLISSAMSAALAIVTVVVMRRPRHRVRPGQAVVGDERQSIYAGG